MTTAMTPPEDSSGALEAGRQLLKVLAPISVVTALLFYFGWVYTAAQARYWGVDATYFDLPTREYVLRSVNAALTPFAYAVAIGLALVTIWSIGGRLLGSRPPIDRHRVTAALFVLAIPAVIGSVIALPTARQEWSTSASLVLMAGGAVLAGAFDLTGIHGRHRFILASLLLVTVGAFSYVTVYAARTGADRAAQYNAEAGRLGALSIFSDSPLDFSTKHGIQAASMQRSGTPDTFQYECLRLLVRLGDTLLVVPERYLDDPARQVIYTIDAASVQLAFAAPSAMDTTCT